MMTELGSSEKTIIRDERTGDAAAIVEVFTDGKTGRQTRLTKSLLRDVQGKLTGTHETVEDMGYSPAVLEAQRQRMLERHRRERLTAKARMSDVTELERTSDGQFRTRARSGR